MFSQSKEAIIKSLENFIEERIKYADLNSTYFTFSVSNQISDYFFDPVVERALPKIFDGDIILTYAQ